MCADIFWKVAVFVLLGIPSFFSLPDAGYRTNVEFSVLEEQNADTFIGQLSSLSLNASPPYTIYFPSSDDRNDLEVTASGMITTKRRLDCEIKDTYHFVAESSLQGTYIHAIVHVSDINDNSPVFDRDAVDINLLESFPVNVSFYVGSATDLDLGKNGVQGYDIVEGNGKMFSLRQFTDSKGSLMFELSLIESLDYEETSSYALVIRAYDGGAQPHFGNLLVNIIVDDINDNMPLFTRPHYSATVLENAPNGTSVLQVEATDNDSDSNGRIEFLIESLDNTSADFLIDSTSGLVSLNTTLNFSMRSTYFLLVTARDTGSPPLQTTATLDIGVLQAAYNSLALLFRFLTEDGSNKLGKGNTVNDLFAELSVIKVDQFASENLDIRVTLDDDLGYFVLEKISHDKYFIALAKLPYLNCTRFHRISLTASCAASYVVKNVTVQIEPDELVKRKLSFTQTVYIVELLETAPVGTSVLKVEASTDQTVTFNIASGNSMGVFQINSTSGLIKTSGFLGCNAPRRYILQILGVDAEGSVASTEVVVNITKGQGHSPVFDQNFYQVFMEDNLPVGTCIKAVSALDPDCESESIRYSLKTLSNRLSFLQINNITGELCIRKDISTAETAVQHLEVTASDAEGLLSSAVVQVLIKSSNHPPVFTSTSYMVTLPQQYFQSVEIAAVLAVDQDSGIFGRVTYQIVNNTKEKQFLFDPETATVRTVAGYLNAGETYHVGVIAVDGGDLTSPVPAVVRITVTDETTSSANAFSKSLFDYTVDEDARVGSLLGNVASSSRFNNEKCRYSISDSQYSKLFRIDQDTGDVFVANRLDREIVEVVLLSAVADCAESRAFAQIRITATDVNDRTPEFFIDQLQITVREDLAPGSLVYAAFARDSDSLENGRIQYRFAELNDFFSINRQLGEMKLKRSLDYESQRSHLVRIIASDSGSSPRSAVLNLSVSVADANDNIPVFSAPELTFSVYELLPIGSVVGVVVATDSDSGDNGKIFYQLHSHTDEFFIDRNSGTIFTKSALDHERRTIYDLHVTAVDNGVPAKSSFALVHVIVLDVNEYDPEFVEDSYTFFVEDNHRSPVTLGFMSAIDLDRSSRLTYSIIPPNVYFTIAANTGKLTTAKLLDREKIRIHTFTVCVTDSGSTVRNATTNVTVFVLDVNDNSPKFIPKAVEPVYLEANAPVGTFVAKMFAVDPDYGENQTITYHLHTEHLGRHLAPFTIDGHSGIITTTVPVGQMKSEYSLKVTAQDGGAQPRNTSLILKIFASGRAFVGSNEDQLSFVVEENSPSGTIIGLLSSEDNTRRTEIVDYFIVQGNQFGTFRINLTTSQLYVDGSIDFEMVQNYDLLVKAVRRNGGFATRMLNVNVRVVDLNDNAPQFVQDRTVHVIRENIPVGTTLFKVQAVDKDGGDNGTVVYSLLSEENTERHFVIDEISGLIRTCAEIDHEAAKRLKIIVVATDNTTDPLFRLSSTMEILILVLDINDNEPVFSIPDKKVSVSEDAPTGFPVVVVNANDADSYENGRVTYSLMSGNERNRFNLNQDSGVLSVMNTLDREDSEFYVLTIAAQDHGEPRHEVLSLLTIHITDVNDNVPKFTRTLHNITVLEELPAGTLILALDAVDPDDPTTSNANFFFYFLDDHNKIPFGIDSTNGTIFLTSPLDRESTEKWIITVHVSNVDRNSPYDSATVVINVLDVNDNRPVFHEPFYLLEVPENANLAVIHTVEASDKDSKQNGKITYSILDNMDGKFSIGSTSGKLSCLALDRELQPFYNLTILATDGGTPLALTGSMQIMVRVLDDNDNDPVFHQSSYSASIPEDIAEGTSIIFLEASDLDEGSNAKVSFTLSNNANGLFLVDGVTGVITSSGEFDREKKSSYSFEAFATDGGLYGPRSRAVRVDINILDVNDNAPVFDRFPYNATIPQDFPVGQTVLTVSATDKDAGQNGIVFYSFTDHSPYFYIDPLSGQISTKRLLDNSAVQIHTLHVKAQDGADRPRNSTGLVSIKVGNAKTIGVLRFANQSYSIYLPENTPPSTAILSVQARFANGSPGTGIMYSFANGNEDSTFRIHPETGLITVVNSTKLDFEVNPRLRLIAIATAGSAYDFTTIWINLKDVNDNAPRFSQHRYSSSVWEGNLPGTYVTQVMATDLDSGANGRITYSITSGNIHDVFDIDPPTTGIVKTKIMLDRELCDFYRLEIEASDFGKPSLTSTVTLRITVIDVNDNAPIFPALAPINIREGTEVGTMISQVSASDSDLNPSLIYGFTGDGNVDDSFSIDQNSGKIFIAKRLDHETHAIYHLTVMVSDEVHNTSANLVVTIIDDNDNAPVFDRTLYEVSVFELTQPDVYVMTVKGRDADSGENGRIEYTMPSVDGFYINSTTGAIYTGKVVLFNKLQQHTDLVVAARDNGTPPLSANVVVRLKVVDVNNHAPILSSASYNIAVKEDLTIETTILQVVATDDDHLPENTRLQYSIISGNLDHVFLMNNTTGSIRLVKALDHEKQPVYRLEILVRDGGIPSLNSTGLVHVTVLDVNDNSPEFTSALYKIQVREDVPIDSSILTVLATDLDSGDNARIQYSITSWNNGTFGIDRETGVIFVRRKLNFESRTSYVLKIAATDCSIDSPRRSASAEVHIQILDVNEYRPQFLGVPIYVGSVVENQPSGTYVLTAKAIDMDTGDYGVVRYRLIAEDSKDDGILQIDLETGIVTTASMLMYSLVNGAHNLHKFKIVAEDSGGMNTSVNLFFNVEPDAMKPRFINQSYHFVVPGSAQTGDVIGQVQALDKDERPSIHIIYFLQSENDFMAVNRTNGLIFLLRDLQTAKISGNGNKNSYDSNILMRSKRDQEAESLQLTVIAQCGFPDTKKSTASVDVEVDRTCELCALVVATETAVLAGTHLILLVVFLIIAVVMMTVVGGVVLRSKRAKNCREENSHSDSSSFETIDLPPPPPLGSFLPPPYLEVQTFLLRNTTSEVTNRSLSASSGRGSVNKGEDVDEEIQLINSEAMSRGVEPDSGLLIDEAGLLEPFLLGSNLDSTKMNKKSGNLGIRVSSSSVESMHHFSDEGGGEGDVLDIGELANDDIGAKEFADKVQSGHHLGPCLDGELQTKPPGSHSTVTGYYEDLGSINWDSFVCWKPDYHACAEVYREIALLKDKSFVPKIKPTQFVIPPSGAGLMQFSGRTRLFPPPIITDTPPRTVPPTQTNGRRSNTSMLTNSNTASSGQTSQLNSVSLPKSALSYESTFTESPNFSSPYTLSISPAGTCSPTVSIWNAVNGLEVSHPLLTKDRSPLDCMNIENNPRAHLRPGLET